MNDDAMLAKFVEMFDCDEVRISKPCGMMFLILGWRRNTKDGHGQWYKNGAPLDFDYLEERAVARGADFDELMESAEEYKRVMEGGWRYLFEKQGIEWTPEMEAADQSRRLRMGEAGR